MRSFLVEGTTGSLRVNGGKEAEEDLDFQDSPAFGIIFFSGESVKKAVKNIFLTYPQLYTNTSSKILLYPYMENF
jgi:hypothetical protein